MVADDEEGVRLVAEQMLSGLGFQVLAAADGQEALDLFREHRENISCILVDLTMPRLSGEQVCREVRRNDSKVPVILCSGYNRSEAVGRFAGQGLAGFLQKPYTLKGLREMLARLYREQLPPIQKNTRPFLRDVHDHTIQVIEILESFQEIVSGLMDIYLSSIGNRMNNIMKVLTIIATIFIPLTFIAGVYGMNFRNMPELAWRWGYPAVLGVMALVFVGMLIYFKRKKWL